MKKSHRKDVIAARIIFAVVCVVLIAVIAVAIVCVKNLRSRQADGDSQIQTESEGGDTQNQPDAQMPDSQEPDIPAVESKPVMQTTTGVNLRSEPNTDCEVVTVLTAGTQLELLGEEDGWALVDYQGQTGYVSTDYLVEVTGEVTP